MHGRDVLQAEADRPPWCGRSPPAVATRCGRPAAPKGSSPCASRPRHGHGVDADAIPALPLEHRRGVGLSSSQNPRSPCTMSGLPNASARSRRRTHADDQVGRRVGWPGIRQLPGEDHDLAVRLGVRGRGRLLDLGPGGPVTGDHQLQRGTGSGDLPDRLAGREQCLPASAPGSAADRGQQRHPVVEAEVGAERPGVKSGALAFMSTGGSTKVTCVKPAFSARIRMLSVLTSSGSVCGRNGATAIE